MAISRVHKYFKEKYSSVNQINSNDIFIIDGNVVVSRKFISIVYGVSLRQITNWSSQWLEADYVADVGKGIKYYNILKLFKLHEENINKTKSNATIQKRSTQKDKNIDFDDIENVDKEEADRLLQIERVKIERLKYAELSGKLIPAEDTDKAMAELGALHLSQYQSDLKILPVILENKSKQEIIKILDEHFESRILDMERIVMKITTSENDTIFSFLHSVISMADKVIKFLSK